MTKPKYQFVSGHPELVRDTRSGAVLNTKESPTGLLKKARAKKELRIDTMKSDLDMLKSEMTEIKSLLKQMMESNYASNHKWIYVPRGFIKGFRNKV